MKKSKLINQLISRPNTPINTPTQNQFTNCELEQIDKQAVEEMREKIRQEISKAVEGGLVTWTEFADWLTQALYNAGYRKQSVGEWIFEFALDGDDFYRCSVCDRQEVINGLCKERKPSEHFPYCHCGAKMKGGAEG